MTTARELVEHVVGPLSELPDPGCREFAVGEGDWPFKGFVVRQGDDLFAYRNYCRHAGHPLNWKPDSFLTKDSAHIICASHGALYDIKSGECVSGPCPGLALSTVDVWVDDGQVWVRAPNGLR